jgi:DNA-binding HxlR family transcriptional regulator
MKLDSAELMRTPFKGKYTIRLYCLLVEMTNGKSEELSTIELGKGLGGVSRPTLCQSIQELERCGWIKVDRTIGEASRYKVVDLDKSGGE